MNPVKWRRFRGRDRLPKRQSILGFLRLSPAQLIERGFSPKSRRYVREGAEAGETISARAFEQARNLAELGRPVTREAREKELKAGRLKYRSEGAAEHARYMRRTRHMRETVQGINRADLRELDRWKRGAKDVNLREIFGRYPANQVREALGSPPRKGRRPWKFLGRRLRR